MVEPTADLESIYQALAHTVRERLRRRGARGDELDDLVQEVFLRVQRDLASLRLGDRLHAWIARIADNLWIDRVRRLARLPRTAIDLDLTDDAPADDESALVASWLPAAIDTLPDLYKDVLRLSELEGIPHAVIAERLGLTVSAIKSRVARGRARLRDAVLACCALDFDRRGTIVGHRRRDRGDCSCG